MVELDRNKRLPLYLQLADALRERLEAGEFSPGEALPDQRSLSRELGVNPRTVARALDMLEVEGLIYKIRGSGAFVGRGPRQAHTPLDGSGREIVCLSMPDTLWWHGTRLVAQGAAEYLHEAGYAVLPLGFASAAERRQRWEHYVHLLCGTIAWDATTTPLDRLLALSRRHQLPTVAVGSDIERDDVDVVDVDIRPAVIAAVDQMLASGCTDVFAVVEDRGRTARSRNYREAMEAAGKSVHLVEFHRPPPRRAQRSELTLRHAGTRAARSILSEATPPFGVFCANDLLAVGVYEAFREADVRMPEDAQVIGCGDDPELHQCFAPKPAPLSAVAIDRREQGRLAAELLVQRLANPKLPPQYRTAPSTVRHRQTTIS